MSRVRKLKKDSKTKIASIYSLALYEAAEAKKAVARVHADVLTLLKIVAEDKDFVKYFTNPLWELDSKKSALKEIAARLKVSDETLGCLDVIADNNRFAEFKLILEAFVRLYYERHNVEEVEVQSAKKLSAAQDKKLVSVLEKKIGKKVVVNYVLNPDLLGGLRVSYGSNMIDDSVSGKLNRLEIMMKGGQ